MIHCRVSRTPSETIGELHISVTQESIPNFVSLINRALNTWDSAPKELKELGDMISHGRITQDHTYKPMFTSVPSQDYHTAEEQDTINEFIQHAGLEAWLEHLRNNTTHKVLKKEAPSSSPE